MTILFPVCLLVSLILLRTAPDMPLSRLLHRWMVLWPIRKMHGFKRHELLLLMLAMIAIVASHWFFQPDSLVFTSRFLAEAAPWLTSVEVSTFLDVATAVLLSRAITRAREILRLSRRAALNIWPQRVTGRRRASRQTRDGRASTSRGCQAANDDEPGDIRIIA